MLRRYLNLFLLSLCFFLQVTVVMVNTSSRLSAQEPDVELTEEEKEEAARLKLKALKESSPLLEQPQTPDGLLKAVILMVDFARPELARAYLNELMASDIDDAALLKLRDQHGPAVFLQLARVKALQPASTKLLKQMRVAFRKSGANPKRIDALVSKLNGTPRERDVAINALSGAGVVVVPRLLQQYMTVNDDQTRTYILRTIVSMGKPAIPPMIAAINAPEKRIQAIALQVLGQLGERSAIDHLWFPAFSKKEDGTLKQFARDAINKILRIKKGDAKSPQAFEIAAELKRLALLHYQNQYRWEKEDERDDHLVAFWFWDKKQDLLSVEYISRELASIRVGYHFSKEAFQLLPENKELQSLYLGMAFALDLSKKKGKASLSIGKGTAFNSALAAGEETVSRTLTQALQYHRADIAQSALHVLSQVGSRNQLSLPLGKQSPIIAALNAPDRRVQFAAAVTILQLDPQKQFRGSTRVVAILSRALKNEGVPAAIVIHPNTQISVNIASLVGQVGFSATTAKTGKTGFTLAAKRDDIEIFFVDANVARWGLSQTIANLRADARTAYIPIVVFGPDALEAKIMKQFGNLPLFTYIDKPESFEQIDLQLRPFLAKLKTPESTPQQRQGRVTSAAYWLAHIANGQRTKIFNITPSQNGLIHSLDHPELFDNALQALSVIPNKKVQQQFQKIAINTDQKKPNREAATLQLAFHIQRFGLLLEKREIAEVKTAWKNASDAPALSAAFATVIGSLKLNKTGVSLQLRELSP
ncbi:hypothetical protein MNBD_PLANCTO02-1237 [hydrothermal vent metagenome]|uniref:Response regulatory domain-containing protein n=1 Tax=hydrothermal vent metagenome TaxID=652676 RepID=A0A3B1DIQ9_9ZZZZ